MKKSAYLAPLLLAALGLNMAAVSSAYAEEEVTTDTVMVTATRSEKDIQEVPMSVSVITEEEISRTSAADLEDLLRDIPGIRIKSSGNASNQVYIRGEDNGGTLVLVDGVKYTTEYTTMGNTQIPSINPANIERIEVIKGPASVLYGSDAFGGVINIITKKGGENSIQGEARLSYSTDRDAMTSSLSVFGKVDDFSYRLSGSAESYGDVEEYHTKQKYSDRDGRSLSGYVGYDVTEKMTVGMGYEHINTSYQTDTTYADEESVRITDRIYGDVVVKDLAEFLPTLKANFSYLDNEYDTPSYGSSGLTSRTVNTLGNYSAGLQADWVIGSHTSIVSGYEWLHESYENNAATYSTSSVVLRDADADTHALFAAVEHYLPYDFTLSYGARFTSYSIDFAGSYTTNSAGTTVTSEPKSGTEGDIVYSLGLVWTGIDDLALRATFSQGYQAPSFYMKYLDIPMSWGNSFVSNPDLQAETLDNYEIGARYKKGGLDIDAALFYTETENRLDTFKYVENGTGYTQWINVADSKAFGLEFSTSYQFDNGFKPYATGTWMKRKSNELSYTAGAGDLEYEEDMPSFSGTLGVKYYGEVWDKVFLNADLNLFHQTHVPVWDITYTTSGYVYDLLSNKAVTTLNLSIGAEFGEEKNFYTQLNLNNITDKKYYYSDSDTLEPGFNANLIVGYRF